MIDGFVQLVCAHLVGDFLLQTDRMAGENKRNPRVLLLHVAIHGVLVMVFTRRLELIVLAFAVLLVHALIDFIKCKTPGGTKAFVIDQGAHLLSLFLLTNCTLETGLWFRSAYTRELGLLAGFIAAVWGVGHFIRLIADGLCAENAELKEALGKGLKNGGARIGKLERALIFLLVLMGQPTGVGFLIAAKSVLRFEEAKKQPLAEYVLIGTLWSFGLAMAIAVGAFRFYVTAR